MAEKHSHSQPPPLPPEAVRIEAASKGAKGPPRKKGEFRVGDWVKHQDGATCKVTAVKDDGTLQLVTDDEKHAFDAAPSDVEEAEHGTAR